MNQRTFFDDDVASDMAAKRNATSGPPVEDVPRTKGQALEILARLRQGPATNTELTQICLRYSARIHELRRSGHTISGVRGSGGVWVFTLEDHPQ